MRSFVGQPLEAITLAKQSSEVGETDATEALTDNYLKLQIQGRFEPNLWLRAKILAVENHALIGRPV
jgi:hypothetical protein